MYVSTVYTNTVQHCTTLYSALTGSYCCLQSPADKDRGGIPSQWATLCLCLSTQVIMILYIKVSIWKINQTFREYNSWSQWYSGTSPRYQKQLSGTSPNLHYWCLGLVPWIHFWYLGPDNGGHYLVPGIKNVSLGPVPDVNNWDWDWSHTSIMNVGTSPIKPFPISGTR